MTKDSGLKLNRREALMGLDEVKQSIAIPVWNGFSLEARSLLLYFEQGFGDTIQMLRFLPMLAAYRPKSVHFMVQEPLRDLTQRNFPDIHTIPFRRRGCDFDFQLPLMSLPLRLGIDSVERIPGAGGYLQAKPSEAIEALVGSGTDLKVGVVWSRSHGGAGHLNCGSTWAKNL